MKVSVCMATYNGEKYIKEQLDSILPQLKSDDEMIISDDNSTDKTVKIIEKFNDNRIKIFKNELSSRGYTQNFENSLDQSSGDIIFLADQDDVWLENKVELSMKYLDKYDFVVSNNVIVNDKLDVINESHFNLHNVKKGFLRNLLKTRYVGACMAFKRKVLLKSLPFPCKSSICAHDYWICLVAELYFKTCLIEDPLILYRRHSATASSGGNNSKNSLYHKLKVRIYTLFNLIKIIKRRHK